MPLSSLPPSLQKQQPQQLKKSHFGYQKFGKIKYETQKKFIPSPELIIDSSQSSSSESNEQFIMKNHHHEIPVSENLIILK